MREERSSHGGPAFEGFEGVPIAPGGDPYGAHRVLEPRGALPQAAWRLDNDFAHLFGGETLLGVESLNIDAASFAQIEEAAHAQAGLGVGDEQIEREIAHILVRTVADRGKQHNPVTGSGGMLLGRVMQIAPALSATGGSPAGPPLEVGDRVATLVSLSLTPLRIDAVGAIRRASAQVDVTGQAVLFSTGAYARLDGRLPERVALAALDVAGAAPQVARLVRPGSLVLILGAGGKSGVLCAAEARRCAGPTGRVIGIEAHRSAARDLETLGFCDVVVEADARDPIAVRAAVLAAGGREVDVAFSCVNVPDAEMAAILATRDRGVVHFFAMSTSFTKAALGAEGVGKDVDLFIGNGYAHGHAQHTLDLVRSAPGVLALFERRYG